MTAWWPDKARLCCKFELQRVWAHIVTVEGRLNMRWMLFVYSAKQRSDQARSKLLVARHARIVALDQTASFVPILRQLWAPGLVWLPR